MEAIIEIHESWLEDPVCLMNWLHDVISGPSRSGVNDGLFENGPFEKESGYHWQLDASNDWWAEIREDKLVLAWRYPNTVFFDVFVAFVTAWLA